MYDIVPMWIKHAFIDFMGTVVQGFAGFESNTETPCKPTWIECGNPWLPLGPRELGYFHNIMSKAGTESSPHELDLFNSW